MTDKRHEFACMICGQTLVYGDNANEQLCTYCGIEEPAPISCPNGHYVCDSCHSSDALEFLRKMGEREDLTDPVDIINLAYSHPSFNFHGPEHHSLVPAAILLSLKNKKIEKPKGGVVSLEDILEGIRRGSKIPGGFCGYAGTCGACVGAGVAIAVFLGSTPKTPEERELAHRATQRGINLVQDHLVRCCKRSTFYGVTAAIEILREVGIDLGQSPPHNSCKQWEKNRDCERERCVYFPGIK